MQSEPDKDFFNSSLKKLKENISSFYTKDNCCYTIALSRKGPRLLERLFDKKYLFEHNIVSEHALPILFRSLKEKGISKCQLLLVDDAVYYGTTILGLKKEIQDYAELYGIKIKLELFATIISDNAKEEAKKEVVAECREDGYSHYFVKNVMSQIRSLEYPIEIEYPIIEYRYEGSLNTEDAFLNILQKYFGENSVYKVFHDENKCFCVLLDNTYGCSFNKLRIYIQYNHIYIAAMAPRALPNDLSRLEKLFELCNDEIKKVWEEIINRFIIGNIDTENDELKRNRTRSIMIMANYLLSYDSFCKYKDVLESCFSDGGIDVIFNGVRKEDLKLLVFDEVLCNEILICLNTMKNKELIDDKIDVNIGINDNRQIFEEFNYPLMDERNLFDNQNKRMIFNCKNTQEKLSVIFFNQTMVIEKWSRRINSYDNRRLRFGYTIKALVNLLSENINSIDKAIIPGLTH